MLAGAVTAQHQSCAILSPKSGPPPQAPAGQTRVCRCSRSLRIALGGVWFPELLARPGCPGMAAKPGPAHQRSAGQRLLGEPPSAALKTPPQKETCHCAAEGRGGEPSRYAAPRVGGGGASVEREDHHFGCLRPGPLA